jgi:hypothetical protein
MRSKILSIGHKQNFSTSGTTVTATVANPENAIEVLNVVRKDIRSFCTDITGVGERGGLLVLHFRSVKRAKEASSLLRGKNLGGYCSDSGDRVLHN